MTKYICTYVCIIYCRVGLLTFADDAKLEFNLNSYMTQMELLNALHIRYTGGTTNTSGAIRLGKSNHVPYIQFIICSMHSLFASKFNLN